MFWCLNVLPCCFFRCIFEVKVSNFYWSMTWEISQNKIGIKSISKFYSNGITPDKFFSILSSFFMPHVGPKWNNYLLLCWLTLKIRFHFQAKLYYDVIWFVKCMKIEMNSLTQCTVEFLHWVIPVILKLFCLKLGLYLFTQFLYYN